MGALDNDIEMLESAMRSFFRVMKRPQHWAKVAERAGVLIDRPSAAILHVLATSDQSRHCRVQDLAHHIGIEAPSITRKTQELASAGLLERVPDPVDRRAVVLNITAKGRSVSKKIWKAQREIFSQVLSTWDASERQQFVKLFERFSTDFVNNTQKDK